MESHVFLCQPNVSGALEQNLRAAFSSEEAGDLFSNIKNMSWSHLVLHASTFKPGGTVLL